MHAWANSFKRPFIEQLTKRTGNYKAFNTFLGMLSNVIEKTEPSENRVQEQLSYSILTLEDLRKMQSNGSNASASDSESTVSQKKSGKRYFILKYSTKYDKTLYPLPLNHAGIEQDDVSYLEKPTHDDTLLASPKLNSTQISTRGMEQELQVQTNGINAAVQQALIEKQATAIAELEDKLRKRGRLVKDLKNQIEQLQGEKKLLTLKNKNLVADLAEYKRGFSRHEGMYKQTRGRGMSRGQRAPISRESSPAVSPRGTGSSLRRSRSYDKPWQSNSRPVSRSGSTSRFDGRPRSTTRIDVRPRSRPSSATRFERRPMIQRRSSSVHSVASSGGHSRSSSIGRFDPTAYVEKQQAKRRKNEVRRREKIRSKQFTNKIPAQLPPAERYRAPPIKNYVEENIRKNTSGVGGRLFDCSIDVDMANIDARLNSLQQYINDLDD